VSSKSVALVGAALLLLDFASTVVVSAAAATSYISGEVPFPMPQSVGSIIILLIFLLVGMLGMKESARSALIILTFHVSLLSLSQRIYSNMSFMIAFHSIGSHHLRSHPLE
jgi:amino acid transporter